MSRPYRLFTIPALVVILLDQISKAAVVRTMPVHKAYPVIDGLFDLVHVRNRGMAFGLMNCPDSHLSAYLLMASTVVAILLLLFWFTRLTKEESGVVLGLSLVLGGALGNLIDRIRLGEVVDFLDFYVGHYHWPAFNVADMAITIGTLWLALNMLFPRFTKASGVEGSSPQDRNT
ncbi:MAG: signal peptidase II [Deltaproteobacteria bacterium]|nr:signal peptidase II [Deltaproteobacteria bacterium]